MDPGGFWPTKAAAWNPASRMHPRFSPSYKTKIVLERVSDDVPDYGYRGPVESRFVTERLQVLDGPPSRPFEYIDFYKPVTPPIPVIETIPVPVKTTCARKVETCVPKRFFGRRYRFLGYTIVILAILTFALELVDVIVAANYMNNPCGGQTVTNSFTIPWFFSWVAPGLWGSIPIFITGILAMTVKDNYDKEFRALAVLATLSALFFAPSIIAISSAEIATFLQYCNYTSVANVGSLANEGAKFALPIVIIVLGAILFLLLIYLTYLLCRSYDECVPSETVVIKDNKPTTTVAVQPAIQIPVPTMLPAVEYIPAPATLPPPPPRDMGGVPGRVVFMEAHNQGYAYSNTPGYFTTTIPTNRPTTTILQPADSGYYWK